MRFAPGALFLLPLVAARTIDHQTIFDPPDNYTDPQVLYARSLELADGTLLATWENYSPEPPLVWFPIYESTDGGASWAEISKVTDDVNGWGLRYQPALYQLPEPIGEFEAGTVLLSGDSIPTDLSQTRIDVYASRDLGYTWEFVSHVAAGGEALPTDGLTPVWEPFFLIHKGELILYYSDQRENETHSQKLVHQTTTDLHAWTDVVDDVAYANYSARPGMPTVARLPSGDYIYTYEYGGAPSSGEYWFPVYYRISADPLDFYNVPELQLKAGNSTPEGSPYVVWSPWGGRHGTIVASSGGQSEIFVNQELGRPDAWRILAVPETTSYTRSLLVFKEDPDLVLIIGGGHLPPSTTNVVSYSIVRLSELLGEDCDKPGSRSKPKPKRPHGSWRS